jgi:hypothetical protein
VLDCNKEYGKFVEERVIYEIVNGFQAGHKISLSCVLKALRIHCIASVCSEFC